MRIVEAFSLKSGIRQECYYHFFSTKIFTGGIAVSLLRTMIHFLKIKLYHNKK